MEIFNAEIVKEESSRFIFFVLPFNAKKIFNKPKGTIFVKGNINNIPFRNKLLSRGNNMQIMIIDKSFQKIIGFKGERMNVRVEMEPDDFVPQNEPISKKVEFDLSAKDVIDNILTRRSIRKYTFAPVSEKTINTILHAGLCAPSASNKRPFRFVVIKNKNTLQEMSKIKSNIAMLENAACAIIVCGDKNVQGIRAYLRDDCAAATQNMLLCINGLGLGGVWCGVTPNSEWYKYIIKKMILPLKIEPHAVIAFGYADEKKTTNERFEIDKIHYEKWQIK